MDTCNLQQLCRICITSNTNSMQMISIFGEDSLWRKITTLADVKIEKGDTLPQQVCVACAKTAISACLFKKKCEDADNFYRQQLLIRKIEGKTATSATATIRTSNDIITLSEGEEATVKLERETDNFRAFQKDHTNNDESDGEQDEDEQDEDDGEDDDEDNDEEGNREREGVEENGAINDIRPDDDGEIKPINGKVPFDFHSIRLMHEYMQQQLSKINGAHTAHSMGSCSEDAAGEDDEPLPLIPEIELITPSEDINGEGVNINAGNAGELSNGLLLSSAMRGYQCPTCFQIFEMKQILKAHMQSVHGTAGPVYECSNCKKTYFYKRFLEKHVRRGRCVKKRRNQTRPMQCSDCHVLFPTGHHLGWHKRTGCPSRAEKVPLQQLFKQNIVQYNNFPKRIGIRKPENAIYLHNRKLIMANNKRKGRTRIKLDARKIALAKQLILREATTTVIANELNISRTFAWRLRKSLVNGVSLHERVIDQNAEEPIMEMATAEEHTAAEQQQQQQQQQQMLQTHLNEQYRTFPLPIKTEKFDSDNEEAQQTEEDALVVKTVVAASAAANADRGSAEESDEEDNAINHMQQTKTITNPANEQMLKKYTHSNAIAQMQHTKIAYAATAAEQRTKTKLAETLVQIRNNAYDGNDNNDIANSHNDEIENEDDETDNDNDEANNVSRHQNKQQQKQFLRSISAHSIQNMQDQVEAQTNLQLHKNANKSHLAVMPQLLSQFPPAVAAAIHQLPVNLSIRPIASMQNNETSNANSHLKKPRKPNVFIDDEKYDMAKMLVAQNASTMEIARALNVSQMTAWKVRDAIVKGVPLSYRSKRDIRSTTMRLDAANNESNALITTTTTTNNNHDIENDDDNDENDADDDDDEAVAQNVQLTTTTTNQEQLQQQIQQMHLQQQMQQQLQQLQKQQQQQLQKQQEQQQLHQETLTTTNGQQQQQQRQQQHPVSNHKMINPRRRLKAAEREVRDKEITREILELIKEDSNIQYWKVSARLAEKGFPISPSSVCQKLKSMGIHRRWKPGDKPPPLLDMEQLKSNAAVVAVANSSLATSVANSSSADESYEPTQFDLGGAHFLSAFTTR